MKYRCNVCEYETDCRVSWHKHKKTAKHHKNVNSKLICQKAEDSVSKKDHEIELLKQKLESIETDKKKLETQLKKTEKLLNQSKKEYDQSKKEFDKKLTTTVENYKNELVLIEQKFQSTIEKCENHINTLQVENNYHKQLINSAGGIIKKSMGTLSYLLVNYNSAPCLNSLSDYSIISKDVELLIKELIYHHNKNNLGKYLGDFLVKQYKKDNPELQALWNSDTERLNYFIRELHNMKHDNNQENNNAELDIQWIIDRKGLKVTNRIINPLLDYISNLNKNYLTKQNLDDERLSAQKLEQLVKNMYTVKQINNDIHNNVLSQDINKYIAPHFYLNKIDKKAITKT